MEFLISLVRHSNHEGESNRTPERPTSKPLDPKANSFPTEIIAHLNPKNPMNPMNRPCTSMTISHQCNCGAVATRSPGEAANSSDKRILEVLQGMVTGLWFRAFGLGSVGLWV